MDKQKDESIRMSENQGVDIVRIRRYFEDIKSTTDSFANHTSRFQEGTEIADMVIELCDLVEGSTLLQDAARARQEAQWLDEPLEIKVKPEDSIHDLDPEMAEELLPSIY